MSQAAKTDPVAPSAADTVYRNGNGTHATLAPPVEAAQRRLPEPIAPGKRTLAILCYEAPDTPIGRYVARLAAALRQRGFAVHLFARQAFEPAPGLTVHRLGEGGGSGLVEQVEDFGRRAAQAYAARFPASAEPAAVLGFEWSTIPALQQIQDSRGVRGILSLHSLERQRSDMTSELSQRIHGLEMLGLSRTHGVLVHQTATAELARTHVPACGDRLTHAWTPFPTHEFETPLDPGSIKARVQVGPIDPMILFIGDLDERHGADVLMKSAPAILKNHKQARFVFVGCGDLYWPLRVHARYLLLEHAVRLPGSIVDRALYDLIQAADVIVAPSREATMWWPVQAAWAAGRPCVVSQPLAQAMQLRHEEDCVSIYPHESSCTWGVERLLFDAELREKLGRAGRQQVADRFGFGGVAEQIEKLIGVHA